jgi:enterochelin esterase-like enzyme
MATQSRFHFALYLAGLTAFFWFGISACQLNPYLQNSTGFSQPTATVTPTYRIVDLASITPASTPTILPSSTVTPKAPSSIESGQADADWLPYSLNYQIYLPAGYAKETRECYPLLILLHGQSYQESQWLDLDIQIVADEQIQRTGKPYLIAMPREVYYLQEMEESLYSRAIGELLVNHLLENYPICKERSQHAVGGISRGAAWAVHVGFEYPQTFAAIGAHSLPPHRNDIHKMQYWVKSISPKQPIAIYIDIGAYDRYVEAAQVFQNALVKYHIPHEFHLKDGTHEDAYWQLHLPEYLDWYANPWLRLNSSD